MESAFHRSWSIQLAFWDVYHNFPFFFCAYEWSSSVQVIRLNLPHLYRPKPSFLTRIHQFVHQFRVKSAFIVPKGDIFSQFGQLSHRKQSNRVWKSFSKNLISILIESTCLESGIVKHSWNTMLEGIQKKKRIIMKQVSFQDRSLSVSI